MNIDRDPAKLARELRRLADAATPGPWHVRRADDPSFMAAYYLTNNSGQGALDAETWDHPTTVVAITLLQDPNLALAHQYRENSEFIAASRAHVPRVCHALERALEERAVLADALRTLLASPAPSGSPELDAAVLRAKRLLDGSGTQPGTVAPERG